MHPVEQNAAFDRSRERIDQLRNTREVVTEIATGDNSRKDFVRVGEFLADAGDDDLRYVVDGLLPAGGTAILAGRPKGGKSTLALNLALAVARGSPFLHRDTCTGPVLYLALEGARGGWRSMLRTLGAGRDDDLYFFVGQAPRKATEWLRAAAQEHRPVLIIIDTMQRLLRVRDGNDYAEGSNVTDEVIDLARRTGAALVMLHHTRKSAGSEVVDEVLGSTAWAAAVDSVLVLRRSESCRTLQSEQRFGENLPETVIEFDRETLAITPGAEREERDRCEMRRAITEYLDERSQVDPEFAGATEVEITASVAGRNAMKRTALREAVNSGEISRIGSGKRGDPFYYAVSRTLVPAHGPVREMGNPETQQPRALSSYPPMVRYEKWETLKRSNHGRYPRTRESMNAKTLGTRI